MKKFKNVGVLNLNLFYRFVCYTKKVICTILTANINCSKLLSISSATFAS